MNQPRAPKHSGWRIRGKQKYYLTITGRKFFKPYASAACRRDKKILAKTVLAMLEKVNFEKTICRQYPRSDLRFYGIPQAIINSYYNRHHIASLLPWQSEVLSIDDDAVLKGRNLVYSAPTGVGKSLVYEILLFRRLLFWHGQCLIVLPFVSLLEEKRRYLEEICEENGIFVDSFHSNGAQYLDNRVDVLLSTIEKANLLINKSILEGRIPHISLLVIDEAQSLTSPRGYLIELLVTKLRAFNPHMQIIALSATLPSPHKLSSWLDASLYNHVSPSHQSLFTVIDGCIRNSRGDLVHTLPRGDLATLLQWLWHRRPDGKILVFCPTRAACERAFHSIRQVIPPLSPRDRQEVSHTLLTAGLDAISYESISAGMCVHHAGVRLAGRLAGERLLRGGNIRGAVATSTLATGVNLG
ncbi:hypothetical protein WA588_004511, partial [Blastocystis sp. NMH]